MLRMLDRAPPDHAQAGLGPTLRAQGYFLSCLCAATNDLTIADPRGAEVFARAAVVSKELVGPDICRIRLCAESPLTYRAGQFINIRRGDGLMRSYSLASVPRADAHLELHVRRMRHGEMSGWIIDTLAVGESVEFYGPAGACFYLPGREDDPLLLVGTGTGLAPLVGIARDALLSGHRGPVHLYHGSDDVSGLYLDRELRSIEDRYASFHYHPCVAGGQPRPCDAHGFPNVVAFAEHPLLRGWRIYLCGLPAMVTAARRAAYLAEASLFDIYADPFEQRDANATPR